MVALWLLQIAVANGLRDWNAVGICDSENLYSFRSPKLLFVGLQGHVLEPPLRE